MATEQSQLQLMKPYLMIAGLLLIVLLAVVFWPQGDKETPTAVSLPLTPESSQALPETPAVAGGDEPSDINAFEPLPDTQEVVIGQDSAGDTLVAPPVIEVPPAQEAPLDVSDQAIAAALKEVIASPALSRLLVTDSLLQRFVINVNDLANGDTSPRSELVKPPQQSFATYQQADKTFIQASSYTRYSPYVEVLESAQITQLVDLLDDYEEDITARFAEISKPGVNFNDALIDAIDTLLATPAVNGPIEVYSDSVAYKFADERLEALPEPQKQLIRTGPQNMARIKVVLAKLKAALEVR